MKKYHIDIGSSTIKTYGFDDAGALELIGEKSILFKDGFTPDAGIAAENVDKLVAHFLELAERSSITRENTKTFATGIWREVPAEQLAEIGARLPVDFNVISHEDEARYLKQAAELDYNGKKVLVINMGGKTTEAITVYPNGTTKSQLLKLGVADLSREYPSVTDAISGVTVEEAEAFYMSKITDESFDTDYDFALLTGELRFQKLTGYPLQPNTMFNDVNHPSMQSLEEFIEGTRHIFFDLTMDDLFALMPYNPVWMTGARQGAILPLAIFRKAGIKIVVPSDLNLINGAIKG